MSSFQKGKKRKKATPGKNASHTEGSDTPAKVVMFLLFSSIYFIFIFYTLPVITFK